LLHLATFLAKITDYLNQNSVYRHSQTLFIFTQTNLRENRLFANEWQLVSKNGIHNVKFHAVYFTFSKT
jgi:hypothetical protein